MTESILKRLTYIQKHTKNSTKAQFLKKKLINIQNTIHALIIDKDKQK